MDPADAGSLYQRGLQAARAHQHAVAAEWFRKASSADPRNATLLYCHGLASQRAGRTALALESYGRAIALRPDYAEAYFSRANLLRERGRLDEALADYTLALAIRPAYVEAHCNLAILLRDLHRLEEARDALREALRSRPDYVPAQLNLANVLNELGEWEAAQLAYDRAIELAPDYAEAYCNRSFALLLRGHFRQGWRDFEWRWRSPISSNFREKREWSRPAWKGDESLAGKTILLHSEQGLGDTIQFARYAHCVAALGARVILEVQPPLVSLLAGLPGVAECLPRGSPLPEFDVHCPLMSLPLALGTDLDSIPAHSRYLDADAGKVSAWRARLGAAAGPPRVGLVWSGSATKRNDRHRSIPLEQWLARLPDGLRYVSLQKEVREADRPALRAHPEILDPAEHLHDFSDTAALCDCLDLVLSVDTSVAHLSAALGKPTWILLPATPDWRWLLERHDSPWYPSARLYRQTTPGDWLGVMARVGADLTRLRDCAV